jgi:uncharacterized protein YndB with AHSA1/START domain
MVDVDRQIHAVTREVQTMEVDGEPAHVQTLSQAYPASIEDVWQAVTAAERIARWFLPVSGDLRVGGHFQLEGNAGGEVQECAPPAGGAAHYRITWSYGGAPETWVTVRLEAVSADETLVELEHIAKAADVPQDMWAQFGPSGTGIGWDSALLGLALDLGAAVDGPAPEEGPAWMVSDEGLRFTRASALSWASAHVEDGADEDTAMRAAEATYLLYTGQSEERMPET